MQTHEAEETSEATVPHSGSRPPPTQTTSIASAVSRSHVSASSSSSSPYAGPSRELAAETLSMEGNISPSGAHLHLNAEEKDRSKIAAVRFAARLASDHHAVLHPDVDTPFSDAVDVLNRLLPYHVFQHPKEDLDALVDVGKQKWKQKWKQKGKEKLSVGDLRDEIAEMRFTLQYLKRYDALQNRFRRARVKSGTRTSPDDQAYVLTFAVLESDRSDFSVLNSELRSARSELDKQKRLSAQTLRPSYPFLPSTYSQYYRSYPYTYAQPYGTTSVPSATPARMHSFPVASTIVPPSGPIPVQLPVTSLPYLASLGIVPIPAAALPPRDQPQPPAVLLGTSSNGMTLSLQVNVALLQPIQMNGLASLLSSLMRGGSTESVIGSSAEGSVLMRATASPSSMGNSPTNP